MNPAKHASPAFVAALEKRYPGVRIVEAYVREVAPYPDDGSRYLIQCIRFQAPPEKLKAHGLVSDAMIAYYCGASVRNGIPDGRRRRPRPPHGDNFYLCESLDNRSEPGHWELTVHTDNIECGRDQIGLREAKRVLKAIAAKAAAKQ